MDLVVGVIQAIDGEKDPSKLKNSCKLVLTMLGNLILVFTVVPLLASHFVISQFEVSGQ